MITIRNPQVVVKRAGLAAAILMVLVYVGCNLEVHEFTAEVVQKTFIPEHYEPRFTLDGDGNPSTTQDWIPDQYIVHARNEEGDIFQRTVSKQDYFGMEEGDWITLHSIRWRRE